MALDLLAIGIWPDRPTVVVVAVIVAGIFIGVNNTLVTTAVMSISPVERPVASATYGFVRFIGGGLAPFVAGKLVEHYDAHVPFVLAAVAVVVAAAILRTVHGALSAADRGEVVQAEYDELAQVERVDELQVAAAMGSES
jgi:MFS family permease